MTSVKSRAHRILNRLAHYRRAEDATAADLARLRTLGLNLGEQYIGVYENSPLDWEGNVVVTDRGLYVTAADAPTRLPYQEMLSVQVPGEKHVADRLRIQLEGDRSSDVPIRGGDGRLREVWEFYRFLKRVRADRDR